MWQAPWLVRSFLTKRHLARTVIVPIAPYQRQIVNIPFQSLPKQKAVAQNDLVPKQTRRTRSVQKILTRETSSNAPYRKQTKPNPVLHNHAVKAGILVQKHPLLKQRHLVVQVQMLVQVLRSLQSSEQAKEIPSSPCQVRAKQSLPKTNLEGMATDPSALGLREEVEVLLWTRYGVTRKIPSWPSRKQTKLVQPGQHHEAARESLIRWHLELKEWHLHETHSAGMKVAPTWWRPGPEVQIPS